MYPNNNNNNNNNINNNNNNTINNNNIIIIIIKGKSKTVGGICGFGRERELREIFFYFFSLFTSFSDLRKSDRRFLSRLKAKLIYATRATRGHQKLGV